MNTKGPSTLLSAHISKASMRVLVHLAWISYQHLKELLMSATIQQLFSFNKTPPNYICITTAWPFCKIACLQSRSVTYWKKSWHIMKQHCSEESTKLLSSLNPPPKNGKIFQFKELLLSMLSLSSLNVRIIMISIMQIIAFICTFCSAPQMILNKVVSNTIKCSFSRSVSHPSIPSRP